MWSQSLLLTSAIAMAVLVLLAPQTAAECNKCNGVVACISETEYALCQGGVVTGVTNPCEAATPFCVNNAGGICAATGPAECTPDESKCGLCERYNEGNLFTCTSVNTYAICGPEGMIEGSEKPCPTGRVCTTTDTYICMPECSLLHGPECPIVKPEA